MKKDYLHYKNGSNDNIFSCRSTISLIVILHVRHRPPLIQTPYVFQNIYNMK